jgi:hypothetical protein
MNCDAPPRIGTYGARAILRRLAFICPTCQHRISIAGSWALDFTTARSAMRTGRGTFCRSANGCPAAVIEERAWSEIKHQLQHMNPYDFQELVAALLRAS